MVRGAKTLLLDVQVVGSWTLGDPKQGKKLMDCGFVKSVLMLKNSKCYNFFRPSSESVAFWRRFISSCAHSVS